MKQQASLDLTSHTAPNQCPYAPAKIHMERGTSFEIDVPTTRIGF
jgi:hypothetical protein